MCITGMDGSLVFGEGMSGVSSIIFPTGIMVIRKQCMILYPTRANAEPQGIPYE